MPSSPSPRSDAALNLARLCAAAALDKKAEDLSLLCLTDLCAYTDYCLLISASSARQVGAVADNVRSVLKKTGIKPLSVSGLREGQWALLDFGEVVVHIFYRPVREYYDLESLWADARRETLDEAELAALLAGGAGFSKIPPSKRGESGTKWRLKRR
jgi:ribosome-associated protein